MKKRFTALLLVLLLCVTLLTPAIAATDYTDRAYEISDYISEFGLAYKDKYTVPLYNALEKVLKDNPELFKQLVDAMFADLDKYSMYMSEEEYEESFSSGVAYVGVGITIDSGYPFGVVVGSVVEGGPADRAGIRKGDIIVSVDGVNVELSPYEEMVDLVRGEAGTGVVLGIRRQGAGLLSFEVVRRSINNSNVTSGYAGEGVGVITLSRFGGVIDYIEFKSAYNGFAKDDSITSVIIDVRGNPGGSATVLNNILDCMVEEEDVTLFQLVNSEETEDFKSTGSAVWMPDNIVVLVDEYSASASEVFAGSLQKLGLAKIVGKTTYGKARSQYHIDLSDGSVAIITAFEVLLSDGSSYEGVGIVPDFTVANDGNPYPLDTLGELNTKTTLRMGNRSADVLAMQKRLHALGILPVEPDGYFGEITCWSLNVFQKTTGLKTTQYANAETLKALENEVKTLKEYTDAQMEFALKHIKDAK